MMKRFLAKFWVLFLIGMSTVSFAKIRRAQLGAPKKFDPASVLDMQAEAHMEIQQEIAVPEGASSLQFQGGKISEEITFYESPRCYLHLKNVNSHPWALSSGTVLKIRQIDNFYQNGTVHITFWFDQDRNVSDLACITNLDHALTMDELRSTLGAPFTISIPKKVETKALANTVPQSKAQVLREDSSNYHNSSTQVNLSGS